MIDESIDNPSYYKTQSGMQPYDVMCAFDLNARLSFAIKYILRAGKKGARKDDIKKAIWFLEKELIDGE